VNDPSKFPGGEYDVKCLMDFDDPGQSTKDIYLSFRPYLFEMLAALKKNFELILFTAGFDVYAKTIMKVLELNDTYFDYVITRDNCTPHPNGKF
jgi:TFIIF-interacting CTD phosphatase-like protein